MKAVEIFAGAGGLAMGVRLAGFSSTALVEWNKSACNTLRLNQARGFPLLADSPAPYEGDVRAFDWASLGEDIDLVAGGPPCQPFSMGGRHRAHDDLRDMFPPTVKIIKALRPKAFILENVKGLTRASFANYFQYILLQLEFPEVAARQGETWESHFDGLQREKTSGTLHVSGLTYNVLPTLVNAADYGIPQKRERVFMVGFRSDLGVEWSFPAATHTEDALLHAQWISGSYWDRHKVPARQRPTLSGASSPALAARIERMRSSLFAPVAQPWRTVRDALTGLPDAKSSLAADVADHCYQAGAKVYPGHTAAWQCRAGDAGAGCRVKCGNPVAPRAGAANRQPEPEAKSAGKSGSMTGQVIAFNHDPGAGRYKGLRPRWDVLHPGRLWAEKCQARQETDLNIRGDIEEFLRAMNANA